MVSDYRIEVEMDASQFPLHVTLLLASDVFSGVSVLSALTNELARTIKITRITISIKVNFILWNLFSLMILFWWQNTRD